MAEKKNIILFIVEAMGGVFTYIVDLANELINTCDVYVAYVVRRPTLDNYRDYFDSRVNLIEVKNFEWFINPTKDIKAFFKIRRIVERVQSDIIHLFSSKVGALGWFVFNSKKVPLFYMPHGYNFLMKNHSAAKRLIYRTVETMCGKIGCTTVSCSKGKHQESLKLNKRAVYVDNGINVKKLERVFGRIEAEEYPFMVVTLGRICYQKNSVFFNKIEEAVSSVGFLWIGDGELREELKSGNIEITGWLDRKSALEKSMLADLFVLTSLREGLPISLLEVMYMKKLCAVSNVIGNRDVIENGKNCLVCGDMDGFVEEIKEQTEDKIMLINMACQDIIKKYNTSIIAEKYSEICMSRHTKITRGVQREVIFIVVCCESTVREVVA